MGHSIGECHAFATSICTPQGDSLSPVLFTVYLEAALRDLRSRLPTRPQTDANLPLDVEYADDTDFIRTSRLFLDVIERIVWSYYVQMMGYWGKLLTGQMWYQKKRTHVLFEMVKSPLRSSLGKISYCQFSEGPLFGTIVTVAPLSGYAKPDECPSYCLLAYAQNRQRDARFSIKTNMPTSSTLNALALYSS